MEKTSILFLTRSIVIAHRKAVEGLVRADSQEVRGIVDREIAKQEGLHQQIIKEYQDK